MTCWLCFGINVKDRTVRSMNESKAWKINLKNFGKLTERRKYVRVSQNIDKTQKKGRKLANINCTKNCNSVTLWHEPLEEEQLQLDSRRQIVALTSTRFVILKDSFPLCLTLWRFSQLSFTDLIFLYFARNSKIFEYEYWIPTSLKAPIQKFVQGAKIQKWRKIVVFRTVCARLTEV